jgi:ribonuclease-3
VSESELTEGMRQVAARLGHQFGDESLLVRAVTHPSFANEHPESGPDFERLEFLGDAVLELILTEALIRRYPDASEGEMTRKRASLVNEGAIAAVARGIALPEALRLGRGETAAEGNQKDSILSDACEGIFGALFLDAGFEASAARILPFFDRSLARVGDELDHKSKFQSLVQGAGGPTPRYRVVSESGLDHEKRFEVAIVLDGEEIAFGTGRSKKEASQMAARLALEAREEGS